MKKQIALVAAGIVMLASCQKSANTEDTIADKTIPVTKDVRCASYEVLEAQLADDPTLRQRMDRIEEFIHQYTNSPSARLQADSVIEIPVVFNVLYKSNSQNISDA